MKGPLRYVFNLGIFFVASILVGTVVLVVLFAPATNPNFLNEILFRGNTTKDLSGLKKFAGRFGEFGAESVRLLEALEGQPTGDEFAKMKLDKPEEVKLKVDGSELSGWYFAGTGPDTIMVSFDGFGKRLPLLAGYINVLHDTGASVFLYDYRGYKDAAFKSTALTAAADGQAAYDYLVKEKKVKPENLILFGRNIGSYVSLRIAQKNACKALVLENPWSSVKDAMVRVPGAIALRLVPDWLYTDDCLSNIHLVGKEHPPILVVSSDPSEDSSDAFMTGISQPVGYFCASEYMPTLLAVDMKESGEKYTQTVEKLLKGKMATIDQAASIAWLKKYDEAIAQAKKESKPLLVDLRADWCGPCRHMDRATFTDLEVADYIKNNFVPLRMDAGDAQIQEFEKKFSFRAIPTVMIIKPDETLVRKHSGFLGAAKFLKFMKGKGEE